MVAKTTSKGRKGTAKDPEADSAGRAPSNRGEKANRREKPAKSGGGAKAKGTAAAAVAERLLEENATAKIVEYGDQLSDERATAATQAARVLGEIAARKPAALSSLVDRFVAGITSEHRRVVQTSADALPALAGVTPARVAKHLEKLKASFEGASAIGKDGLVRTFSALCSASVAYQKRLEPVLKQALAGADGKTLAQWTETVLPVLKGEPHANARAVVEQRLDQISRADAQRVADLLGIKLRPRRR